MSTAFLEIVEDEGQEPINGQSSDAPAPEAVLLQMIFSSISTQVIYVASKLGIADLLADGPKTVQELSGRTETDAPALYRVLRALSSMGIFSELENQTFELTPTAELLRSNVKGSLREAAIFMGEDWHWQVWSKTLYSVRTGKSAWSELHGEDIFDYFKVNKEAGQIFDDAMTSFSTVAIEAVVAAYDFSNMGILVDVAGGHGRLLTALLEANPTLRGVLFDMPRVIDGARERTAETSVKERLELQSGDFFVSVPRDGDAYIMKHIIHDWNDDRAREILLNIKRAMNPGAKILLVETVISERNVQDLGKLLDIEMMVSPGGKERTAAEYAELFASAGLRLTRIIPTNSPYSVIEAVAN